MDRSSGYKRSWRQVLKIGLRIGNEELVALLGVHKVGMVSVELSRSQGLAAFSIVEHRIDVANGYKENFEGIEDGQVVGHDSGRAINRVNEDNNFLFKSQSTVPDGAHKWTYEEWACKGSIIVLTG
ncbi:hypothetical protein QYF36_015749 [Acer negundo]|nr:hypothetical protein QYF36_015749 [Acer negundo]